MKTIYKMYIMDVDHQKKEEYKKNWTERRPFGAGGSGPKKKEWDLRAHG